MFLDDNDIQSLLFKKELEKAPKLNMSRTMLLITTLTARMKRWDNVPLDDAIHNMPSSPSHYRLTLVVTADLPDDNVFNIIFIPIQ